MAQNMVERHANIYSIYIYNSNIVQRSNPPLGHGHGPAIVMSLPRCGVVGVWYGMLLGMYGVYGRSGMACLECMVCLVCMVGMKCMHEWLVLCGWQVWYVRYVSLLGMVLDQ